MTRWHSSKDSNSVKNLEIKYDGGRYVTKSLKAVCDDVFSEPMHLKEEKFSIFIGVYLMELCLIMATPPLRIERGLP